MREKESDEGKKREEKGYKWRERKQKETETNSREIPAHGFMGSSKFIKMRELLFFIHFCFGSGYFNRPNY